MYIKRASTLIVASVPRPSPRAARFDWAGGGKHLKLGKIPDSPILKTLTITRNGEGLGTEATLIVHQITHQLCLQL